MLRDGEGICADTQGGYWRGPKSGTEVLGLGNLGWTCPDRIERQSRHGLPAPSSESSRLWEGNYKVQKHDDKVPWQSYFTSMESVFKDNIKLRTTMISQLVWLYINLHIHGIPRLPNLPDRSIDPGNRRIFMTCEIQGIHKPTHS